MQQMQYNGGYSMQMNGPYHINQINHINSMSRMGMLQGMNPRMNMMNMSSGGPGGPINQSMNNLPIRAGGPSINMRMPIDPHSRMYGGQGRPGPYPNPAMYMAQKRHQSPMYNGQMQGGPPPMGGQYMTRGPFPGQGGYPMGHPHNMGGSPGPGFSGMPPGMRHAANMQMPNNMPMTSSMSGGGQNYPVNSPQMSGLSSSGGGSMRPTTGPPGGAGGGPGGSFPPSMGGMQGGGGLYPGGGGRSVGVKTEIPTVSPRGGGAGISTFQHSPVPGNPTPPLTPNGPGNCISAPFASPQGRKLRSYSHCQRLSQFSEPAPDCSFTLV